MKIKLHVCIGEHLVHPQQQWDSCKVLTADLLTPKLPDTLHVTQESQVNSYSSLKCAASAELTILNTAMKKYLVVQVFCRFCTICISFRIHYRLIILIWVQQLGNSCFSSIKKISGFVEGFSDLLALMQP